MANTAETAAPVSKKRNPRTGKRLTVLLSDEHYLKVVQFAKADDREPGVYLSRQIRRNFDTLNRVTD